ncbi:biotin transporter BioY [Bacillota bacterium]
MKTIQPKPLILCSVFAALTAICSIISIPLPFSPVPVNLALLSVYLAGGLLGARYGALSQLVYVLLGAAGAPVFHNLTGGMAILTGPTGGFIAGYIAAAFLVGLLSDKNLILALISGLFACFLLGTLWFIYITGSNLQTALMLCVVPFIPGDVFKILAAFFLIKKLRPLINKIY